MRRIETTFAIWATDYHRSACVVKKDTTFHEDGPWQLLGDVFQTEFHLPSGIGFFK